MRARIPVFAGIVAALTRTKRAPLDVLSLGCGSCREVHEALRAVGTPAIDVFHGIDQEPQALALARELFAALPAPPTVVGLERANVARWRPRRRYDLIWVSGLFDYLEDRLAVAFLRRLRAALAAGGRIVFNNFHPRNAGRPV